MAEKEKKTEAAKEEKKEETAAKQPKEEKAKAEKQADKPAADASKAKKVNYVYGALLLHSAGKPVDEAAAGLVKSPAALVTRTE